MHTRPWLLATVAMAAFAANSLLCRAALGTGLVDAVSFTTLRLVSGALMLWAVTGWAGAGGPGSERQETAELQDAATRTAGLKPHATVASALALFSYAITVAAFKENGYDPFEATKEKEAGFDYLVSFDGNLFHIATDLSFIQSSSDIYGLGSGGQFALGYLYDRVGRLTVGNVEQHARRAVEIASMLDVNTHPPIQLVTQGREY